MAVLSEVSFGMTGKSVVVSFKRSEQEAAVLRKGRCCA